MAEQPRLTNKQRRALAREERRRKEAAAAQQRKRSKTRNGLVTFAIAGVVIAVVLQAVLGGTDTIDDTILLSRAEVASAQESAGCEVLTDRRPLPDAFHFDAASAPDTARIYTDGRPTHSGPHTSATHPILSDASRQISEVTSTHNLEHGTIIAWYDPDQVNRSTINAMGSWATMLNDSGFRNDLYGVGIMTSPYDDPGISSGKAIALRAWGTAMDCDTWDETVAMGFVLEHFGTQGIAPERTFAPFPGHLLAWDSSEPAASESSSSSVDGTGDDGDGNEDNEPTGQ